MARLPRFSANFLWTVLLAASVLLLFGPALVGYLANNPAISNTYYMNMDWGWNAILAGFILLLAVLIGLPLQHGYSILGSRRLLVFLAIVSSAVFVMRHSRWPWCFDIIWSFPSELIAFGLAVIYLYSTFIIGRIFLRAYATPRGWRMAEVAFCGALFASILPLLWVASIHGYSPRGFVEYMVNQFAAFGAAFLVYLLYEHTDPLPPPADLPAARQLWRPIVYMYVLLAFVWLIVLTPSVGL